MARRIIVPDKEGPTLIGALDSLLVSTHRPMRELIMDGESGIAKDEAPRNYFRRTGIAHVARAPDNRCLTLIVVERYCAIRLIELSPSVNKRA